MHRLASCPGLDPPEDVVLIEQPPAEVLLLSSAGTDLNTLESCLQETRHRSWVDRIRALELPQLSHPAQVDHYLRSTAQQARLIVVRLLGSRGHWSYGFERLQAWQRAQPERQLLILASMECWYGSSRWLARET